MSKEQTIDISDTVKDQIAGEVLKSITPEQRENLLREAVRESIGGYKLKREIEDAITDLAKQDVIGYIKQPDVRERIHSEAVAAAERFIAVLIPSLTNALVQSFMGESSSYSSGLRDTTVTHTMRDLLGIKEKG